VVAGLLLSIGVTFVLDWLWDVRRRLPAVDVVVVVGIAVVIALFGVLVGAAAGVLAAIGLFVIRYSRAPIVRFEADGVAYRSRVDRPAAEERILDERGDALLVFALQSFLFFGTADRLRRRITQRADADGSPIRFVVIGFNAVTGMDSSATLAFERIVSLAEKRGFDVIFTGLHGVLDRQLAVAIGSAHAGVATDLDHAVEHAENALIAEPGDTAAGEPIELVERLLDHCSAQDAEAVAGCFEQQSVPAGGVLMRQGDAAPGLFYVRSGRVSVDIEMDGGRSARLRTLAPGSIVGEMSLYFGSPCSATVTAETAIEVEHLSPEAFHRLCGESPSPASALHLFITRVLARRLATADELIRSLLD
jgi:SulP family sulfate permease